MQKQSANFSFGNETEIEDLGNGLKRQMLGYNEELMAVKNINSKGHGKLQREPYVPEEKTISKNSKISENTLD